MICILHITMNEWEEDELCQIWSIQTEDYFNTCTVHFYYFVQWTNKCKINWQFIILLLHVSTLLCHLQGARSQYIFST